MNANIASKIESLKSVTVENGCTAAEASRAKERIKFFLENYREDYSGRFSNRCAVALVWLAFAVMMLIVGCVPAIVGIGLAVLSWQLAPALGLAVGAVAAVTCFYLWYGMICGLCGD